MSNSAIVPGSLTAIARDKNTTVAEAFVSADAIIVVDVSSSMMAHDVDQRAYGRASRYDAACAELAKLQRELPGKIAVVSFSGGAAFCPSGTPYLDGGSTDLAGALKFVHVADGTGMRFVVISDGEPNDREKALKAANRFKDRIDTVFVGPPEGRGQAFLAQLAAASGGQNIQAHQVKELASNVRKLLTGAV